MAGREAARVERLLGVDLASRARELIATFAAAAAAGTRARTDLGWTRVKARGGARFRRRCCGERLGLADRVLEPADTPAQIVDGDLVLVLHVAADHPDLLGASRTTVSMTDSRSFDHRARAADLAQPARRDDFRTRRAVLPLSKRPLVSSGTLARFYESTLVITGALIVLVRKTGGY
jgi:hypothetical protein